MTQDKRELDLRVLAEELIRSGETPILKTGRAVGCEIRRILNTVYRPIPEDTGGEEISSLIGQAIHTGLRKYTNSKEASEAWAAIKAMPDKEWNGICDETAKLFVLRENYTTLTAERDRLRKALAEFREAVQEYYNCSESTVGIKRRLGEAMEKVDSALKGE